MNVPIDARNPPIFFAVDDCAVFIDVICSYDVLILFSMSFDWSLLNSMTVIPIKKSDHAPATPRRNPQTKQRTTPSVGINIVPRNDRLAKTNTGHKSLSCLFLFTSSFPRRCNITELIQANIGLRLKGKNDIAPYAGRYAASILTRVLTIDNNARLDI